MESRIVKQYDLSDDALPLHPDFYEFVQQDERGFFIQDKDGNRWEVILRASDSAEPGRE